jgi:predicted TIM-barrel fold metal-dependent hydrolase
MASVLTSDSEVATALLGGRTRDDVWSGLIVDTDVHAVIPSLDAMLPYLDPVWKQYVRERHWAGPVGDYTYPPRLPSTARTEWQPKDGVTAASNSGLLREDLLDPWRIDHAIVNCVYAIDSGHPDLSVALAKAANDWLMAEWLESDSRLKASMVMPTRHPAAMVAEIERLGDHPGFVQVLLPVRSGRLYGNRSYHPVFEAIERHDLVAGIHWGGSNESRPTTPMGWPSWFMEEYIGEVHLYGLQLTSLIAEGVFQLFPRLRVSMLEIGFTWLPTKLWDLDRDWKAARRELPWLATSPSSVVKEHVRFSAAPIDADSARELRHVIEWLDADDLLMFATDYPHTHDDSLAVLLEATPESMRPLLMSETARAWYRM